MLAGATIQGKHMEHDLKVDEFVRRLHPTTKLLSRGIAFVAEREHDAVQVRNLYGQEIVWGKFNVERGKYKGKRIANNANTDFVSYTPYKYF